MTCAGGPVYGLRAKGTQDRGEPTSSEINTLIESQPLPPANNLTWAPPLVNLKYLNIN